MKRLILLLVILLIASFSVACSNNHAQLEKDAETYITNWNNEEFEEMYEFLSTDSKTEFSKEDFVDRYEKIYKDIKIQDLDVSYEMPEEADIDETNETVDIPIEVSLDTSAGPISFTDILSFTYEKKTKDNRASWKAHWNPGLIFPELKDGGKIFITELEPIRGDILDRNKMPLALNDTTYEIGIIPENFIDEKDEKQRLAKLLNMSLDKIDERLNQSWVEDHLFVPLRKINKDDSSKLNKIIDIPATAKNEVEIRTYPLGPAAAHLVGYVGNVNAEEIKKNQVYKEGDVIGKRGLEELYEKELKGTAGIKIAVNNESGSDTLLAEKKVIDGETISLAIDANIQEYIFDAFDGKAGTASAMDPNTGEVLALVSSPAFEPSSLVFGLSQDEWKALEDDPLLPLINRFSSTFAPGSVIKPITAAIGLKNKTIKPDEGLVIKGLTWGKDNWGGSKVRRVSSSGAPVDLNDALVRSDNIYFAMQAVKMGEDKYIEGLKDFGFNSDISTSYPIKQSSISRDGKLSDEASIAHASYGQGEIEMSSLHLAASYSPILNDGNMLKPRILSTDKKEVWSKDLLSEDQVELLQDSLRTVVTNGTGKVAQRADFPIAGKTGTAELKSSLGTGGSENGWFIGYPDDQQNIIIAMMMEEVQNKGASGMVAGKVTDILIELRNKKIHSE